MADTTPAPSLLTPEDSAVLASTSTIQRVLIAQSVFEKGTDDFAAVSNVLHGHALLRECASEWFEPQVRDFFLFLLAQLMRDSSAQNLQKIWVALMHNIGQDA